MVGWPASYSCYGVCSGRGPPLFIERIKSPGIAHISYLVGDGTRAAVIDPRRDCGIYAELARRQGARITHIFETHRNEDYVIGSVELAAMTGAEILHGKQLDFAYGTPVGTGDAFDLGSARLSVLHTPGHTFESISIALADRSFSPEPVAVFTGDALFIGDVGRTDFFPGREDEVAGLLHQSIFETLLPLGDHVLLYPAHGAGSVCGAHLASREFSTLGYERLHNVVLKHTEQEDFVAFKRAEHHYKPPYFTRMEQYNLSGPPPLSGIAIPGPMSADEFASRMAAGMVVLDVRGPEAFGGAHIPGSVSMPLDHVPVYAGWLVPYDVPIGLVIDSLDQVTTAREHLLRIGYDTVSAYLHRGMTQWEVGGREFEGLPQVYIGEVKRRLDAGEEFLVLDVRSAGEFAAGHLRGALNIYLGDLPQRLGDLPRDMTITTFCGSGARASIAASILKQNGFGRVENCLGSMAACRSTECPLELD
ncbi:MAG TPA: MBL fold metallo-hydrolase [Armatimonadetes bacterium]|nr:MBL fold metallo-hydrolase [Armatimonadota bacterium]